MRVGTCSLLWGVHQFILHPYFVRKAWLQLYGEPPTAKQMIAIIVHDWGYWGCKTMDGSDGELHPALGGRIMRRLFPRQEYEYLAACHSRTYARIRKQSPSRLCWADKLAPVLMPRWLYVLLGRLSGELEEYRELWVRDGFIAPDATIADWYDALRERWRKVAVDGATVTR